jgi:gliding motility-associated-like protein
VNEDFCSIRVWSHFDRGDFAFEKLAAKRIDMINSLRITLITALSLIFMTQAGAQLTFLDPVTGLPTTSYTLTPSLCQGASVDHCINVTSAGTSHSITSFSGSAGTIVIAPPSNPFQRCFRYTAPFAFTGPNTVTFTVTNNLGESSNLQITIIVVNPNTPLNAGPDQQLCSPTNSTTLTALSPDPLSTGYWTKLTGPGTISGGTDSPAIPGVDQQGGATVNVTGLQLGSNIFIWHQDYPCDQNVDVVTIYVYNGTPPVADANTCFPSTVSHVPDTVILCGTTSYNLCANNPGTAATGTWTIFGGCGVIFNINNPNAPVTNLCAGCNNFEWNIGNGPCPGGETKDTLVICVYPSIQTAVAPADLTRCIGTFTSVTLAGNALVGANTAQWTFVSGPVTPTITSPATSSTSVTGLTQPGVYCFNYTITSGPCGSSTDQVCISVYSPSTPINAGIDQTICLPNNSATMAATTPTFPATGIWTTVAGTGSFVNATSPTSVVNGLSVGINTFRWTVSNGNCANNGNFDEMTITVYPVNQPAANAGADQNFTYSGTAITTTLSGNAPTAPGTGTWTVSPAGPIITNPALPNSGVTNLLPGQYTFTWCLNNGSCDAPVCDQMIINVFNCLLTTPTAGPDQNLCSPSNSVTLAAGAVTLPATGSWSTITGGGSFSSTTVNNPSVTNIPVGINTYRWTVTNGACGTLTDDILVNVFDNTATVSNAGLDQEFCATAGLISTIMTATTPVSPATGTWTVLNAGTVTPNTSPSAAVTNLPVGAHSFVWTVNNGPCGIARDTVVIRVYAPGQTGANAGPDQELCSTNPNTTLVANNLVSPATGLWTIVSGGGTIVNPTSSATAVTNIPIGNNVYRWTIDNGPCATPVQLFDDVTVDVFNTLLANANAGPDQDVCSNIATINLTGSIISTPTTGLWTVSPSGPNFSNATISNPSVTNLTPGTTYTFTWTVDNGPCSSTSDAMVLDYFNNNQPAANAGPDLEICQPQSSVVMDANVADSPAIGTWLLISGPNTPTFTSNNPTTSVTNLITGTYVFRWSIDNGACSPTLTFDEMTIEVFDDEQLVANAGLDQELCEPVNETTLTSNNLISPATGFWTQISGPNTASINNPNLQQVIVSNLVVGCYVFRWTVSNGACDPPSTFDDVQVCVFDDSQSAANAGPDQTLCTPASSTTLAANTIISPATGIWTVISGPNTPTFSSASTNNATISNLIVGTYILEWCVDNGACFNANTCDQMIIEVFQTDAPNASAGADQSICTPQDAVFMDGNDPIGPATGIWTVVSGSGAIVDPSDPETQITNLPVGTNCFQWTIDNGGCGAGTTFDLMCVDVFPVNQPAADAGEDQDMCTPQSSTNFEANTPIAPATGSWQQISGPTSAVISNISSPTSLVSGLDVGCYEFVWTIDNGSCPSPISTDTIQICVFNSGFPPAFAGANQELCWPTDNTVMDADGAISPGQGTWNQISGPTIATFSDINDSLATITGLAIGVYEFEWSLNYSACGSEGDVMTITIYSDQQLPSSAGADQFLCTPTSSTTLAANSVIPPGVGTWTSLTPVVDFVNENDPNTTVFNLAQGIDTLIWTIYNGPCLAQEFTVDTVLIYLNDVNQPTANAGDDQEWCTPHDFASLVGNSPIIPAFGTWTTTGTATISNPSGPDTDVSNLELGTNTFCWTIDNGTCDPPTTTDCVDIIIFSEDQLPANAGPDQDVCGTVTNCATLAGNALISPAVGTWQQISGLTTVSFANPNDPTTEVCGMIPGIYVLQWCIENGPCGEVTCDQMTITIYDNSTGPATVGDDIEMCSPENIAVMNANVANLPGFGIWTLVSGGGNIADTDNPATTITDLPLGTNEFSWCISNGVCPNASTCDTIRIDVFDEFAPVAFAGEDQDWCDPVTSIFMTASTPASPGYGIWTAIGSSHTIADINDPETEISDFGIGEYIFLWTVYNGPCENTNTTDLVNINIFDHDQQASNVGPDIEFCTPQNSVVMNATVPTFPATGYWSIVGASIGNIQNITSPTTEINGLVPGIQRFSWTITNGPCVPPITSDTIAIHVFDSNLPDANAGQNDSLCAPFDLSAICTTLNGSLLAGAATGEWTQIGGPTSAIFENSTTSITEICDLLVGTYTFVWTVNNGPCSTTTDTVLVVINDPNVSQPSAGEDAFYCTPTSTHIMSASAATAPAYGYWQSISPNVTVVSPGDPNSEITNLTVGQHIFLWHFNNGACGTSSFDDISIFIFDEFNPPADAGPDQEICLPLTEVTMNASFPFYPAVGQWSQIDGCGSIAIGDVNNPNSQITGLCLGTQCLLWTVNNGPCPIGLTQDTICVRVFDPGITVDAGPDQSICTPQVSVTMDGTVPQDPNYGTWTVITGGGTIVSSGDPVTVIDDLPVGINCFQWELYNGNCENGLPSDNLCIYVYDQGQPAANAGVDIELCYPDTFTTLSANLPILPATGHWNLVSGNANIVASTSNITSINGLTVGNHVFTWTIDNGPCENAITVDTIVVKVFPDNPQVALAGNDQQLCTPDSSVVLSAVMPLEPSTATWVPISLNGTISDVNDANAILNFLTVGIHTLEWHVYNGPCNPESVDAVSISVYDATAPVAFAGEDMEICAPQDTVVLHGSIITFPGTGEWSLGNVEGSPFIISPNDSVTTVSNLAIGKSEFIWTFDNGACGITSDTVMVSVFDPASPSATANSDSLFCDPPACVDLIGSSTLPPAFGWWEQIAGDITSDIADSTLNITTACNLALNESAFAWSVYNGACPNSLTSDTVWFYIYDSQVAVADAGKDSSFCGEQVAYQLQGSGLVGTVNGLAAGFWTGSTGTITDPSSATATVNDMPVGVNCYTWTVDNGACGTTSDEVCITVYDPEQPAAYAGEGSVICEGDFVSFNLNANEANAPASGLWSVIGGPADIQDPELHDALVTYLGQITVPLMSVYDTLMWTIDNGVCGISMDTIMFELEDCETVKIPDAFSPNGDGVNDAFFITNLQHYPQNNIQIFNRWGALVYSSSPYKGDWDGTSQEAATIGSQLPVSTYYYVLSIGSEYEEEPNKVFTGFVYLKR